MTSAQYQISSPSDLILLLFFDELYVHRRIMAMLGIIYDYGMTWKELLMSPWCWVPVFFAASLVSERWMPIFAMLAVVVATVWWEQIDVG